MGFLDKYKETRDEKMVQYINAINEKRHMVYGSLQMTYDFDNYHANSVKRQKRMMDGITLQKYGRLIVYQGIILQALTFLISLHLPFSQTWIVVLGFLGLIIGTLLTKSVESVEATYEYNLRIQYEQEYLENREKIAREYLERTGEKEIYK